MRGQYTCKYGHVSLAYCGDSSAKIVVAVGAYERTCTLLIQCAISDVSKMRGCTMYLE